MQDGKVRWMSTASAAPITVFLPAPAWQAASWNLPLLCFALFVLTLTVLLWPIAALVRRHYHLPLALQPAARRCYHYSRIAALLNLLFAIGWLVVLVRFSEAIATLSDELDLWIRIIEIVGALAVVGIAAVIANVRYAWSERGRWWRKLHSAALLVACLAMAWFAFSLHLLNLHLNY
jgi:hypothetical protein